MIVRPISPQLSVLGKIVETPVAAPIDRMPHKGQWRVLLYTPRAWLVAIASLSQAPPRSIIKGRQRWAQRVKCQ